MSPDPKKNTYAMPVRELMDILTAHTADRGPRSRTGRAHRLRARLASESLLTRRRHALLATLSHQSDASSR